MTITYTDPDADVPSPIDFRSEPDARAWVDDTDTDRPWRSTFGFGSPS
jgi:hypothetical protein